jgi:mandelamide amidase
VDDLGAGRVTARRLVEDCLTMAKENEHLGGFITIDHDAASSLDGDDRPLPGPLSGVPIVVKDNIHVAGLPNTAGTPALRDFTPEHDAPAVRRLREAGCVILGKANMHELAFGITGNNHAYGAVRNPHDLSRMAGGSSGGVAALVAAGVVPAGLGTDTGGSVRIPAALTGICGFRPTTGRYPAEGVTPLSSTRDTIGPMARRVADLAILDGVLSGDDAPLAVRRPGSIRLGVPRGFFTDPLGEDVSALWPTALERLAEAGIELVPVQVPEIFAREQEFGLPIVFYETRLELSAYLETYLPGLTLDALTADIAGPDVRGLFEQCIADGAPGLVSESVYQWCLGERRELRRAYAHVFAEHRLDGLVFPTTPATATDLATCDSAVMLGDRSVDAFPTFIRNTSPSSLAGIPSLSIPMGIASNGMPAGLEIDAPAGTDRALLTIGRTLEAILR